MRPFSAAQGAPYLINAQQRNYQSEPKFIRDRFAYIDSLPFDGMTINTETGRELMKGATRSYRQMALDFGPLNRLSFKRLKHNFAVVNVHRPADFFDDWSATVTNFRLLARSLRARRIEGIFFDNEEYEGGLFNYPNDCSYAGSRSLAQYQDQARLRGREIMQAMVREYPAITFIVLHGPYSSFAGTPGQVRAGQTDPTNEELRGPFSVGMIEGLGPQSNFVDGGELYAYRTDADFQESYDFRKTTIASAGAACPFITSQLRPEWSNKVSVGFGVFNLPFNGVSMNPTILRTTLERALRRADQYVWLYSEGLNWNAPGETSQDWVDAASGARAAVAAIPVSAPSVSITSPVDRALLTNANPLLLTATASSPDRSITKVEYFRGTTKIGESSTSPYAFQWATPPAGTSRVTALATDSNGAKTVSSPLTLIISSRFVARINFQSTGVTPPVSFLPDSGDTFGLRTNGLSFGWNLSHQPNARRRETNNLDLYLATLCQIQSNGRWEMAVPNGAYRVTVGIGDGDYASSHTVNVEGVNFWTAQALAPDHFLHRTRTVQVTDGKLTLDQGDGGFEATRINYLTVTGSRPLPH